MENDGTDRSVEEAARSAFEPANMRAAQTDRHFPHGGLTHEIIGAAMRVHNTLGPGFPEAVYQAALFWELSDGGIQVLRERMFEVDYGGRSVGEFRVDLLVDRTVICELKAVEALVPVHEAQLLAYLKASRLTVGLLFNFGGKRLEYKRMIH